MDAGISVHAGRVIYIGHAADDEQRAMNSGHEADAPLNASSASTSNCRSQKYKVNKVKMVSQASLISISLPLDR